MTLSKYGENLQRGRACQNAFLWYLWCSFSQRSKPGWPRCWRPPHELMWYCLEWKGPSSLTSCPSSWLGLDLASHLPGRTTGVFLTGGPFQRFSSSFPPTVAWAWQEHILKSSPPPTSGSPTSSTSCWPCTTGRGSPWRWSAQPSSTSWKRIE